MGFVRPGRSRWIARALCALVVVILAGAAARAQTFTVTRGANGGNGSLRWAINRANANPGSTIAFNIPASDSRYDAARGVWRIRITSSLPVMTGAGTLLDGTTQTANQGNTNPVVLGTGGGVGVDGLTLPLVAGPEIEIVDAGGLNIGFDVNASNITIRGIAVYGFGNASNNDSHADIRVGNVTNTRIEQCVLGTPANVFADPGAGTRSPGDHVRIVNGDNGILRDNLIGFSQGKGVQFSGGANGWLVEGNEIRRNGITNANLDAIDIENSSGGATIRGNLLVVSEACGVDSYQSSGSNNIVNNDVIGNGIGSGGNLETPGVRLYGSGSIVDRNVIHSNVGAGVMVTSGSSGNRITRNSIYDNGPVTGQIGIDLLTPTDNSSLGTSPYVTPNDSGDSDSGGNGLLNFPVLLAATLGGGQLTLTGFARPASSIEWFEADLDPSGFGEGRTFLGTTLEGAAADQDSGTGTYTSPVNGLTVGVGRDGPHRHGDRRGEYIGVRRARGRRRRAGPHPAEIGRARRGSVAGGGSDLHGDLRERRRRRRGQHHPHRSGPGGDRLQAGEPVREPREHRSCHGSGLLGRRRRLLGLCAAGWRRWGPVRL